MDASILRVHGVESPGTAGGGEGSAEVSEQQVDLGLVWEQVVQELAASTLSPQQRAWMRVTRPIGLLDGTALLAAPSDFAKEAIERALREPITAALSRRLGRTVSLAVKVDSPEPTRRPAATPVRGGRTAREADRAACENEAEPDSEDEVDEEGEALADRPRDLADVQRQRAAERHPVHRGRRTRRLRRPG